MIHIRINHYIILEKDEELPPLFTRIYERITLGRVYYLYDHVFTGFTPYRYSDEDINNFIQLINHKHMR